MNQSAITPFSQGFTNAIKSSNNNFGITPYNQTNYANPFSLTNKVKKEIDRKVLINYERNNNDTRNNERNLPYKGNAEGLSAPVGIGVKDGQSIVQVDPLSEEQKNAFKEGTGMAPWEFNQFRELGQDRFNQEKALEAQLDAREQTQSNMEFRRNLAAQNRVDNQNFQREQVALDNQARRINDQSSGSWQSIIPSGGLLQQRFQANQVNNDIDYQLKQNALQLQRQDLRNQITQRERDSRRQDENLALQAINVLQNGARFW